MYKRRTGRVFFLFLMAAVAGIYILMEMRVLAAPEQTQLRAKAQQVMRKTKGQEIHGDEAQETTQEPYVPLIAVDAGHGGEDSGCLGSNGVFEKDINLQIALLVKSRLEKKGFRVMMLRETDEFLAKEERAELANSYQADIFVSIHQNTYEGSDKSVSGIETWYDGADESRENERLARLIHQETIRTTGANERVLWDIADLCVTNKTLMPACLIETGFLTNPEECRRLSASEYQDRIAEGIVEGIERYFASET